MMAGGRVPKVERFVLGVLFTFLLVVDKTEQGGIFGAPQALYDSNDHVVILNATSIKSTIYGTSNAWVVEFFSSWCGHCINFAPVYKQFAAEVEAWQSVVKVAGIDCADEANIPACREYEIMGYPTMLFFPPYSPETKKTEEDGKSEVNRGVQFPRSDKVSQLKTDLMEKVILHFPNILGEVNSTPTSLSDVWNHVKSTGGSASLIILIFEGDKSPIGKELALGLSGFPEIRVLRFHSKNHIYKLLDFTKDDWPAAAHLLPNLRSGVIPIPKNRDIVGFLQSSALKLARKEGLSLSPSRPAAPAAQIAIAEEDVKGDGGAKEESHIEEPVDVASNSGDVVSLEDLIHAVRNSLRNEVGVFKTISGAKLTALKEYVHILGQLFPADRREMIVFLMKLDNWLGTHNDEVQVNEYLDKMTELELEFHPWDIDVITWAKCKGTVPGRRGYTCSLWRLFHSLTLLATQKSQEISVLPVIHGYVKEFFGCTECVKHFTKMVQDEGALSISAARAQTLWLWRAHNKVNLRLKGAPSEDPGFPKVPYPSEKQCVECQTADGSYDEDKVFDYLTKIYTHPIRTMKPVPNAFPNGNEGEPHALRQDRSSASSSSRFFSGTDYWIFCIVYLSVAALLIFGYIHFKLGYRRRLDPFAICRKILNSPKSMV